MTIFKNFGVDEGNGQLNDLGQKHGEWIKIYYSSGGRMYSQYIINTKIIYEELYFKDNLIQRKYVI